MRSIGMTITEWDTLRERNGVTDALRQAMAPFVESVNLRPYGEVLAEADAIIRGDLATALTQEHHNVLLLEDMRNLDMSRRRLITDIEEKRHWVKEYSRIIGEEMKAQRAVALQE